MERGTDLFAIDLHIAMHHELPSLSRTASKERSEDGSIESSFCGRVDHVHVWCSGCYTPLSTRLDVQSRAPSCSLLGSVVVSEVTMVHWYDGANGSLEHPLPVLLTDCFTMISPRVSLCRPFLLKESPCARWRSLVP